MELRAIKEASAGKAQLFCPRGVVKDVVITENTCEGYSDIVQHIIIGEVSGARHITSGILADAEMRT